MILVRKQIHDCFGAVHNYVNKYIVLHRLRDKVKTVVMSNATLHNIILNLKL